MGPAVSRLTTSTLHHACSRISSIQSADSGWRVTLSTGFALRSAQSAVLYKVQDLPVAGRDEDWTLRRVV